MDGNIFCKWPIKFEHFFCSYSGLWLWWHCMTVSITNLWLLMTPMVSITNWWLLMTPTVSITNLWLWCHQPVSITYLWPFRATDFSVAISSAYNKWFCSLSAFHWVGCSPKLIDNLPNFFCHQKLLLKLKGNTKVKYEIYFVSYVIPLGGCCSTTDCIIGPPHVCPTLSEFHRVSINQDIIKVTCTKGCTEISYKYLLCIHR